MFLEIHELRKSFGAGENRTEVLKGLDFSVEKGEICVLLGPSGSGKSTLLNIIGGIDEADGGYISIDALLIQSLGGLIRQTEISRSFRPCIRRTVKRSTSCWAPMSSEMSGRISPRVTA